MGDADRKIPAVKLFVSQLDSARRPLGAAHVTGLEDGNLVGLVLMGVEFTRVWVQVREAAASLPQPQRVQTPLIFGTVCTASLASAFALARSCGCPLVEELTLIRSKN